MPRPRRLTRLLRMDRNEISFRMRNAIRDAGSRSAALLGAPRWDRAALAARLDGSRPELRQAAAALRARDYPAAHRELVRHFSDRPARFIVDPRSLPALASRVLSVFPESADHARQRVNAIIDNRYDLLGYESLSFRPPVRPGRAAAKTDGGIDIDWQFDPVHNRHAPSSWWSSIRYLDPRCGDHKVIWELNRHQHWILLGQAAWLTGDLRPRERFLGELGSWMAANPPLIGINWASALEVGLRCISWIWALHLFVNLPRFSSGTGNVDSDPPWTVDLLEGLDRQLNHVEGNLSLYFSPNTHLTGEALALYAAGRALPELSSSTRWADKGRQILIEETRRQIMPDGGHAERSTWYHKYSLDFYLAALAMARITGDIEAESIFTPSVAAQARFLSAMAGDDGILPLIGDDDGGSLLPSMSGSLRDVRTSLAWASLLLPEASLLLPAAGSGGAITEEAMWLSGSPGTSDTAAREAWSDNGRSASIRFPESGFYVSRRGRGDHLVVDCGPHGYLNGGHAHAGALSMVLSVGGRPFVIDPGTGTYTMDERVRNALRSSHAHNTLTLDGRSQSQPDGPFHWKGAAGASAEDWLSNDVFDYFEGSHGCFAPARHRRAVASLEGDRWLVFDMVSDSGPHVADVHWQIEPSWKPTFFSRGVIRWTRPDGNVVWLLTTAPEVSLFHGDGRAGIGWYSPAYGRRLPCWSLRLRASGEGRFGLVTAIVDGALNEGEPAVQALAMRGEGEAAEWSGVVGAEVHWPAGAEVFMARLDGAERPGEPRARLVSTVEAARLSSDARFLHARLDENGRLFFLAAAGASIVEYRGDAGFTLDMPRRLSDLALRTVEGFFVASTSDRAGAAAVERRLSGASVRAADREPGRVLVEGSPDVWNHRVR